MVLDAKRIYGTRARARIKLEFIVLYRLIVVSRVHRLCRRSRSERMCSVTLRARAITRESPSTVSIKCKPHTHTFLTHSCYFPKPTKKRLRLRLHRFFWQGFTNYIGHALLSSYSRIRFVVIVVTRIY